MSQLEHNFASCGRELWHIKQVESMKFPWKIRSNIITHRCLRIFLGLYIGINNSSSWAFLYLVFRHTLSTIWAAFQLNFVSASSLKNCMLNLQHHLGRLVQFSERLIVFSENSRTTCMHLEQKIIISLNIIFFFKRCNE